MIVLNIDDVELYDSERNEFITVDGGKFAFKHTLRAISEWEADNKKPFMTSNLENEDLINYFHYMCLDSGLTSAHISHEVFNTLSDYISDSRTATVVNRNKNSGPSSHQVITSELIYSMMVAAGVPFEAENWNVNRLLTLLEVISIQNKPKEKMSRDDIYRQNRSLNERRKKKFNTKG